MERGNNMAALLLGIIFLAMCAYSDDRRANLIYWLIEGILIAVLLALAAWTA